METAAVDSIPHGLDPNMTLTIGAVCIALALIVLGWRIRSWVAAEFAKLKLDLRADIKTMKDDLDKRGDDLDEAIEAAKAEFRDAVEKLTSGNELFRDTIKTELRMFERDLAQFKLHVAQNHVSKGDMAQVQQILLGRVEGVAASVNAIKAHLRVNDIQS